MVMVMSQGHIRYSNCPCAKCLKVSCMYGDGNVTGNIQGYPPIVCLRYRFERPLLRNAIWNRQGYPPYYGLEGLL